MKPNIALRQAQFEHDFYAGDTYDEDKGSLAGIRVTPAMVAYAKKHNHKPELLWEGDYRGIDLRPFDQILDLEVPPGEAAVYDQYTKFPAWLKKQLPARNKPLGKISEDDAVKILFSRTWKVSPKIAVELMRYDCAKFPEEGASGRTRFDAWANGGVCPYTYVYGAKHINFNYKRADWKYGPAKSAVALVQLLAKAGHPVSATGTDTSGWAFQPSKRLTRRRR